MSARYERLWESDGAAAELVRAALVPLSFAFGFGVRVRGVLYDRGLAKVSRAPISVVSVGNLRVGGSGKTPLVLWLSERLESAGRRPAIVTRGYGAVTRSEPVVVLHSDGARSLERRSLAVGARVVGIDDARQAPEDIADEALLLALRGRAPVVVTPDRALGCEVAARIGCDAVLLDDGFQHRRLHRDLDIVLTAEADARVHLLPAGPLREPVTALERADLVVTTENGAPTGSRESFRATQAPCGLLTELGASTLLASLDRLRGREVVAVAGIARPERFLAMLEAAGAQLVCAPFLFGDHHAYRSEDLSAILSAAPAGCAVVTTEKDFVKLARRVPTATRLEALRIDLVVDRGEALVERVLEAIAPT